MTVKELIEQLGKLNQNALVVMSKDSEGNSYSPLSDAEPRLYVAETTWYGEIVDPENLEDDEEVPDDAVPCVTLWPIN